MKYQNIILTIYKIINAIIVNIFKFIVKSPKLAILIALLIVAYSYLDFFKGIGIFTALGKTVKFISSMFIEEEEVKISTNLLGFRKEMNLFTSFSIIDILQVKRDYLKREKLKNLITGEKSEPTAVVGYCKKTYEVGIGYKNLYQIIKEYAGKDIKDINELPEPEIITINPIASDVKNYSREECDQLDKDESVRLQLIKEKLSSAQDDFYIYNSKNILSKLIFLFSSINKQEGKDE